MQIVVAEPPPGVADKTHYADVDIDLGNPRLDLRSFLIHIGELLLQKQGAPHKRSLRLFSARLAFSIPWLGLVVFVEILPALMLLLLRLKLTELLQEPRFPQHGPE